MDIKEDVTNRITAGWLTWRSASGILHDREKVLGERVNFIETATRTAVLYGSEYQAMKQQNIGRTSVAEMRLLKWLNGKIRKIG